MSTPAGEQSRWQRIEELFHRALGLACSAEELAVLVRTWTGDDDALADEVLSLINSANAVEQTGGKQKPAQGDPWLGRVVDGYRIVSALGRGGMGAVYAAERVAATAGENAGEDAQVAIKVVGTRLYSPALIERFAEERRALAALRYPHIAHLLDGGVSETGEPYFVMEYIRGQRLDHYCQQNALGVEAILALFLQLCEAVAFAHSHRILHGDLKPSNVMVTAEGAVKLLDFGASRLLPAEGAEGEEASVLAAFTPEYASPERIQGLPCAAASDVYSLGAMLYRLLTGRAPVRVETHVDATAAVRPGIAENPALGVRTRLQIEGLDADLCAIVAWAMAADPEQRYASATEFAADLKRYAEHRPVKARKTPLGERVRKFVRRNAGRLALVLALVVALAAGAASAVRQTRMARGEEARAQQQMLAVRQLTGFLTTDLCDRMSEVPGSIETQRRVTVEALNYLDGMSRDAGGDFDFQLQLSDAYTRLGNVQGSPYQPNLGDAQGAIRSVKRGAAIATEALRLRPGDARALHFALSAEQSVSEIEFGEGQTAEAIEHARTAAVLGEKLVAQQAATVAMLSDLATIYSLIGDENDLQGASSLGDQKSAIASYAKCVGLSQQVLQRDPGNVRALRAVGVCTMKTANLLVEEHPSDARPLYRQVLAAFDRIPHPPASLERQKAVVHQKLGDCYFFENNFSASLVELKSAEGIVAPYAAADTGNMRVQQTLASIYQDEGESYDGMANWAAARKAYQQLVAILSAALRRDPANHVWQEHYAEALISLASSEWRLGAKAEAEKVEREGLALSIHLAEDANAEPDDMDNAALHLLVAEPAQLRSPALALKFSTRAVDLVHGQELEFVLTLARAQAACGDKAAARESAKKVVALHPGNNDLAKAEKLLKDLDSNR